jgi:hypothetical protein
MADSRIESPKVDWGSILAGGVLATATGLILLGFGAALGLSVSSPYEGEGVNPALYAIAAGLWVLWVQVLSFWIGGYVAARLRAKRAESTEHETEIRDGMHGVLAWGVGVIAAAVIAFAGVGGVTAAARTAAEAGGPAAGVAQAASEEFNQAANEEARDNPSAADERLAERQADIARKLTVIAAFITAASLAVGGAAAYFAGVSGGKHRDANQRLDFYFTRRNNVPPITPPPG